MSLSMSCTRFSLRRFDVALTCLVMILPYVSKTAVGIAD